MLNYPCLVLDHDDTVVRSTPTVNFPPVQEALKRLKPGCRITLEQFERYNFRPGFQALMDDIWKLTPLQQVDLYDSWKRYVMEHIPPAYEGFDRLFRRYRAQGGKLSVVSHSCRDNIVRDYDVLFGFQPDLIFGWELPEQQRKPLPYPVLETARALGLRPSQLLVVDDLKPGCDMAKAVGAAFAGAGWSHEIPEIESYLRAQGDAYFKTVAELEDYIFI